MKLKAGPLLLGNTDFKCCTHTEGKRGHNGTAKADH